MKHITWTRTAAATAVGLLALTGCADGADQAPASSTAVDATASTSAPASSDMTHGGHQGHRMHGGPAPEGMVPAEDPAYAVGEEVTLTADHMPGMDGATATVTGAFDTNTYSVDYVPTTGGEEVTDHKWVVQEELADPGMERLPDGAAVTIEADHMDGMQGAEGTVHSSTDETVYMVDATVDGMEMTDHKWVVESEIEPAT